MGGLRHALLILIVKILSDAAPDKVPRCDSEGGADYLVIFTAEFIANKSACYAPQDAAYFFFGTHVLARRQGQHGYCKGQNCEDKPFHCLLAL
ncbi:hypothetical protein D3C84_1096860 [compost metagenome]